MKNKQFVKYFTIIISIFLGYHTIVWCFFTSKIFDLDNKTSVGDLARMSYQLDMVQTKKLRYTLPKSFIYDKTFKDQPIDMITIGDSFSHGGGNDLNPYYQDYLASNYNLNILNIEPTEHDKSIETVTGLYNSGYLKEKKVKYVLIQSVERFVVARFAKKIDFSQQQLDTPTVTKKTLSVRHQDIQFINTANYKFPYYHLAYKFKENAKKSVYKLPLLKQLFTDHNEVLVFHDDIKTIPEYTQERVRTINKNFNKLAQILKKDGIQLIFMPTTDKYDLYYKYLKNNHHPKNPFYDMIRPLEKEYIFVDVKKILEPLLDSGEKDIYFVDDTHWSCNASEAITNDKVFRDILK